ncbi:SH3 domain-containing protein [Roseobacter sp. EG26]|uniref:SH3 domain-containing protein n=1 Tax=Roseobacter sp. EG26 TaxID=3412477 RepID=UPI003CE4AFDE
MKRFILLSFGFLGLAFYEMSGGSDFDAAAARDAAILARSGTIETAELPRITTAQATVPSDEAGEPSVTRVALNLTSLEEVLTDEPAAATEAEPEPTPQPFAPSVEQFDITPVGFGEDAEVATVLPSIIFSGSSSQASSSAVTTPQDIRLVNATAVNMRGGPGTNYGVVTRLDRDTQVEVLRDDGTGWVKLRPVAGGPEGWVADFLLSKG